MKSVLLILGSCLVVEGWDIDMYENLALKKPANQSSVASGIPFANASRANDGNRTNVEDIWRNSCIHTDYNGNQTEAWWTVDLQFVSRIHEVLITYRNWGSWGNYKGSSRGRLVGFSIFVSNTSDFNDGVKCFQQNGSKPEIQRTSYPCSAIGRFVTVYNNRTVGPFPYGYSNESVLELCEVEIPGCRFQYFGQNCANRCFCRDVTCDYKTGQCNGECQLVYVGESCNKSCNPGYFGENCSAMCPQCGGNKTCNQSGVCLDECEAGFYHDQSPGCSQTCGNCIESHCNQDGSCPKGCSNGYHQSDCKAMCPANCNNGTCDQLSGMCFSCPVGYFGTLCKKTCPQNCKDNECDFSSGKCFACNPGYFGENCSSVCPQCGGNKTCNQSGVCLEGCETGFYQDQSPGCSQRCGNCMDSQCEKDGRCPQGCSEGYYLSHCNATCPNNCTDRICAQETGMCTSCVDGYFGNLCDKECVKSCKERKCELLSGTCMEMTSQSPLPLAIGSACGGVVIVLVIIIVIVIVYRRKRENSPKKKEQVYLHSTEGQSEEHIYTNTQPGNQFAQTTLNEESVTFHHIATPNYEAKFKKAVTPKLVHKPQESTSEAVVYSNIPEKTDGIAIDAFHNYVILKQKEGELEAEFKSIPYGFQYPHVEAEKPENMPKNRFKKTFPYDHSRVILSSLQGRKTDYINANYIDGYKAEKQYIATQGPISNTIGDFWRMTWENKVDKVVMVTNLKEGIKTKCEQYWPDPNKPIRHDGFEIACLDEREFLYYAIRNIRIENRKTKEQRKVWHFHFTTWPDHGTPDALLLVLFHRRVMNTRGELGGPMIVHCSAGIGRTGTFIGLDALFKQGQHTGSVDVKRYVGIMRKDRMNMIQTEQQYECLHEALAEALQTQNTVIMMDEFTAEWRKSESDSGPTNQRRFRKEYDILVSLKKTCDREEYTTAMQTVNKKKNRNPAIIASDKYRPFLNSYGGDRTDYINAVILPTHTKRNGYIVTQRPLSNTVLDFWQMIEEHEISKIVLFEDESDEKTMFYPGAGDMDIDNGVLQKKRETDYSDDVTMITLAIVYSDVADDRKVTIVKVTTHGKQLPNTRQILKVNEIIASMEKTQEPCCVISQNGSSPCDIYCTVTNIQESMKIDNEIDVFQTARQLQLRRPEFFGKYENYELCLKIINEHLTYDSVYFNS